MDGKNLDLQIIRDLTTPQVYTKGLKYCRQERVNLLQIGADMVTAKVLGDKEYSVAIEKDRNQLFCKCTCQYGQKRLCKHIVAVLLYIHDNSEEMNNPYARSPWQSPGSDTMDDGSAYGGYSRGPLDTMRQAIVNQRARGKKNNKKSFWETIEPDSPPSLICRKFLDEMYANAKNKKGTITDKNRIRFNAIEIIAKQYEDKGYPEHAIEMHKHMCEYISENIDVVDNLKQYYTGQIQSSMRHLVTLVRRLESGDEKQEHMLYLFTRYMQEEIQGFAQIYLDTLSAVARGKNDKYCASLFESQLSENPIVAPGDSQRGKIEIIEAASSVLEKVDMRQAEDLVARYHMESEELCTKYIWHLADANVHEATQLCTKAAHNFVNPEKFEKMRRFILQKEDLEYADSLRDEFVKTSDWLCYEELKEIATDWPTQIESVLDDLRKSGNLHTCIDILLHEKKTDEAVKTVLDSGNLSLLDAYSHEFAKKYSDKYYAEYERQIPDLVQSAKTRHDYNDIKRHIIVMRKIPGHSKEIQKLLAKLEAKYPQLAEQMEHT